MSSVPFHETQQAYGVTQDCLMNCHTECRSLRCRCSCHQQAKTIATQEQSRLTADPIQTGLDKYCPTCHKKAPSEHFYCKVDGARLSSLRCPECGTPGEEVDNFCCHCGCSMKAEDRQMEAAATGATITGNRLPEDSHEIPAGDIGAEAAMRVAMGERSAKTVPAPRVPKISMGMFK